MSKIKRIFTTASKDITRNKWGSCTSIAVLGLTFLVLAIFLIFSFVASKVLNFVETRPHIEAFFNTDVSEDEILKIKDELEKSDEVEYVDYTDQKEAAEYLKIKYAENPLILEAIRDDLLPPSLAIRAKKIDYVSDINDFIVTEAEEKGYIYKISYNKDTTNLLKDLLLLTRCGGIFIVSFLTIVIFLITLITIESNIKLRAEEIKIMQLVGGGRWYIRLPFVLQGIIFGALAALSSALILIALGAIFYYLKDQSPTLSFIINFFSDIDWPSIEFLKILLLTLIWTLFGAVVGGINSLIAVFKYFK